MSPCAWVMFGKCPTRTTVFSVATDMATVMKSRTTDVRIFFSDLVDFAIYVVRSGGATIFLSRFPWRPQRSVPNSRQSCFRMLIFRYARSHNEDPDVDKAG